MLVDGAILQKSKNCHIYLFIFVLFINKSKRAQNHLHHSKNYDVGKGLTDRHEI